MGNNSATTPPLRTDEHILNELNCIQATNGYISKEDCEKLAVKHGIPIAQIQGLVSFFQFFRTRPIGKHHLSVCCGSACYARGASLIYDQLKDSLALGDSDTSADGLVTIDKVYCIGACSIAPVIVKDNDLSGKVKAHQIPQLLHDLHNSET